MANSSDFVIENGVLTAYNGHRGNVVLPEGVLEISKDAMHELYLADTLHLPSTLAVLPTDFSINISVSAISVDSENSYFKTEDGVLFSRDMRTLICYPCHRENTDYTVPFGVETLAPYAFYDNADLKKLLLPPSLKRIESRALFCLHKLKSLHIPKDVSKIGDDFLWMCGKLKSITVDPENIVFYENDGVLFTDGGKTLVRYTETKPDPRYEISDCVESIAEGAFCRTLNLRYVSIPESVKKLGSSFWCSGIREIDIHDGIDEIPEACFADCYHLHRVRLPEGLTRLEPYVFDGCERLCEINIHSRITFFGEHALSCTKIKKIKIPEGTKSLGWNLFANAHELAKIELPTTLETIEGPLLWCTEVTDIKLPDGLKKLERSTFEQSKIKTVKLPCGVTEIPSDCFSRCEQLTKLDLTCVRRIEDDAFAYCPRLESLTFSKKCEYIADGAFDECPKLTVFAPRFSYAYRYAKKHKIPVKAIRA